MYELGVDNRNVFYDKLHIFHFCHSLQCYNSALCYCETTVTQPLLPCYSCNLLLRETSVLSVTGYKGIFYDSIKASGIMPCSLSPYISLSLHPSIPPFASYTYCIYPVFIFYFTTLFLILYIQ